MDCIPHQEEMFDLKVEDHSPHYLFNSMLEAEKQQDAQGFGSYLKVEDEQARYRLSPEGDCQHFIDDLKQYLCLRTTPLREILHYLEAYFPLTNTQRKALIKPLRRHKNQLKRQHAKLKNHKLKTETIAGQPPPLIALQSQSSLTFHDGHPLFLLEHDSNQTRQKKKNRMSAQISRDKRKQYIREIERENKELKSKIHQLQEKLPCYSQYGKEFLKMVLCLGVNCLTNVQVIKNHPKSPKLTHSEFLEVDQVHLQDATELKEHQDTNLTDLERCKKLLSVQNQANLDSLLNFIEQRPIPDEEQESGYRPDLMLNDSGQGKGLPRDQKEANST